MNPGKEIVVFEYIGFGAVPFLLYHILAGHLVWYLRADPRIERLNIFKTLLVKHRLEKLSGINLEQFRVALDKVQIEAQNQAVENASRLYERGLKSRLAAFLEEFLRTPDVHLAYRKALSEKLYGVYLVQGLLKAIVSGRNAPGIYFIPGESLTILKIFRRGGDHFEYPAGVKVAPYALVFGLVSEALEELKNMIFLAAIPFWLLSKIRKIERRERAIENYQLGVKTTYDGDWGFMARYRSVDFALDGGNLAAGNTLFCIETRVGPGFAAEFSRRGYFAVEMWKIFHEMPADFLKRTVFGEFLPAWMKALALSPGEYGFVIRATVRYLLGYLRWECFNRKYFVRHYLAMNDVEDTVVIKNILLSRKGTKTCLYDHSSSLSLVMTPLGREFNRHLIYSNLLFDRIFCWGNASKRYQESHCNKVGEYIPVGCLWSEHVGMARDRNDVLSFLSELAGRKFTERPGRIFGVFDTSFGDGADLTLEDMAMFIEGIEGLLDASEETVVIFKEKRLQKHLKMLLEMEFHPSLNIGPVYERLRGHPRCLCTGDAHMDSADIIAASDLVISACFTSTTVEALGAGKKAVYFDASGRFSGIYYNQFPNLVAHGQKELERLIRYWLHEVSEEAFEDYLDRHVKGEIDAYADGKAISRLRGFLSEGKGAQSGLRPKGALKG